MSPDIAEISALPVSILNGNQQTAVRNARLGLAAAIAEALGQFLIGRQQPCTFAPFEDETPANHDLAGQVAGRLAEAFDRKLDEGVADRVQRRPGFRNGALQSADALPVPASTRPGGG